MLNSVIDFYLFQIMTYSSLIQKGFSFFKWHVVSFGVKMTPDISEIKKYV